jgi:hypothetical protein
VPRTRLEDLPYRDLCNKASMLSAEWELKGRPAAGLMPRKMLREYSLIWSELQRRGVQLSLFDYGTSS